MNLHEYQGKQLFADYGLPVSKGYAVDTPKEATEAADMIGGDMWVVKAQVHAGGRGKAGGAEVAGLMTSLYCRYSVMTLQRTVTMLVECCWQIPI